MSERPKVRWVKVTLWTLLIAFVALAVLGIPLGRLFVEFIGLLLLGWLLFLSRVLPQITLNWEIAFNAGVALGLALFGLHRILCWWRKRSDELAASPWRFAWTVKISAMVLLLFATSIAAVGIVHQIAWLCREPRVIVMIGWGEQSREMSDLKQVATACRLYADDHEGRFPAKVSDLIPDYLQDHRLFFTKGRGDDPPQLIIYHAGYRADDPAETLLVASPRPFESSRGRHRVVVFVDTSGRIVPEAEFQELMLRQWPPHRGSKVKQ
jgi:hypothetical protein